MVLQTYRAGCSFTPPMVEPRGVEPLSENPFMQPSTCVVYLLQFPHRSADKQADRFGSFIIHFRGKA